MRVCHSKLDPFMPHWEERTRAGVWNLRALLRELREWKRGVETARQASARELRPSEDGKAKSGDSGPSPSPCGRRMMTEVTLDEKMGTQQWMHEEAFVSCGGRRRLTQLKRPCPTGRIGP